MGKEMRQWDRLQHLPSNKLWKTDVNKEAKEIEIPKEKLNVIRYTIVLLAFKYCLHTIIMFFVPLKNCSIITNSF